MAQNNRIYRSQEDRNLDYLPQYSILEDSLISPFKIDRFASQNPQSAGSTCLMT